MNGRGNLASLGTSKWNALNQVLREKKIGVLGLQETHLDEQAVEEIHRLYGRRIKLFNSAAENATSTQGVAFVLNREIVDTDNASAQVIIPGRALILRMRWHADALLTILNVYAPNNHSENMRFWSKLEALTRDGTIPRVDVLLGDFNIVEEPIDRLPARPDPHGPGAVQALRNFLKIQKVLDGWRITDPTTKDYTFPQRGSRQKSRLDRIYASEELCSKALLWDIQYTAVQTDHKLAIAKFTSAAAPFIGKGRWCLPPLLLDDETFIAEVIKEGERTLKSMDECTGTKRTPERNPQTLFKSFKEVAKHLARERLRTKIPKLKAATIKLQKAITDLSAEEDFEKNVSKQKEVDVLRERILGLERKRHGQAQAATTARYILNAECPSKYWSAVNKDKRPRDLFYSLKVPDSAPPAYESRSDKMAELARDYHDALQREDINDGEAAHREWNQAVQNSLETIMARLPSEGATELIMSRSKEEILEALKKAGNGKAAGVDGLTYEFWLTLHEKWTQSSQKSPHRLDGLELLRLVYADIDKYGISDGSGFADGWMCPIYKKKDRREISNYRPITLLNADYKVYTRIIATRLGRWATSIIHPDQAGFVPGRRIMDQTQTCRVMVDYAEAVEENGVIVALDQEKAYDKIRHEYLWMVLERFGLPKTLIDRIRRLYESAATVVIINGEVSSAFRVTRGVRQGDPLSCLLFDIAIEPLACALRGSTLKGFHIPGTAERLIATLFADDTSTFLAADDTWGSLWSILERWCSASGARFNGGKTEIVPIGSEGYRESVRKQRRINPSVPDDLIPGTIHIADENEPVRILGAWIGNGTDEVAVWTPTLLKIKQFLDRWGRCRPSLMGKKHIVQMGPGGISQYLTMVQGMPKETETEITNMIRTFMWGDGAPRVALDTLTRPIDEGGIGLLDVRARNEAIDLMWVKSYLTLTADRPRWAFAVDIMFSLNASRDAGAIKRDAQINTFLQSWSPKTRGGSRLPEYLKKMLNTAKKYNVSFAAIKLDTQIKTALPIWYHLGATKQLRRLNNTKISNCLRDNHGVRYVADLLAPSKRRCYITAREVSNDFLPPCSCNECEDDKARGCKSPMRCCRAAENLLAQVRPKWNPQMEPSPDNLSLTKNRRAANTEALKNKGDVLFDPSLTTRGPLQEAFRAFVDPSVHDKPPAIREKRGRIVNEEGVTVYIQGRLKKALIPDETLRRRQGAGFVAYVGQTVNCTWVNPEHDQTQETGDRGDVLAAIKATMDTPRDAPLRIVCPSRRLLNDLTERLPRWEDVGWLGVANATPLRSLVNLLRQRCAPTTLGTAGNRAEHRNINITIETAVRRLADDDPAHIVTTPINKTFDLSGAKIAVLTQATAYKGVRTHSRTEDRPPARATVDKAMKHLRGQGDLGISEAQIWRSLRNRDIHRKVTDFLWKTIHAAHRIGAFWSHIPGYEDRAICPTCGVTESMEHIMIKCRAKGRKEVWALTGALWAKKGQAWPSITMEDILLAGTGLYPQRANEKRREPLARLWRIIIPETAHLIWKMRCERVIGHEDDPGWQHTKNELTLRWYATMNRRLHLDLLATRRKFGHLTKNRRSVQSTWTKIIGDELGWQEDWTQVPWVLVGIDPGICATVDPG
ncbi:hypothetical protein EVJ58_g6390 [Rhodofomes roseus]|uniref:Reverse transcriptase domain-containing protein n=1 Tax=Rhodofomes roseus TaxID=34475 RepID=A0A4Y9Y8Y6_9APHY|nr:hypothetical protein EVJ58_g6390 [Rhodofomes roseus]